MKKSRTCVLLNYVLNKCDGPSFDSQKNEVESIGLKSLNINFNGKYKITERGTNSYIEKEVDLKLTFDEKILVSELMRASMLGYGHNVKMLTDTDTLEVELV